MDRKHKPTASIVTVDDGAPRRVGPRRHFLRNVAALAVAAVGPHYARAQRSDTLQRSAANNVPQPDLRNSASADPLLIRGATVLTMDDALGDFPSGDILVRDGKIAAIGPHLDVSGVPVLEAENMIALPGLIDCHWHLWNALARAAAPSQQGTTFFDALKVLSRRFQPYDNYLGARYALAEAVAGGMTHVTNWAHNVRSPAHADAELAAMFESGIGGRFLYGYPQDLAMSDANDLHDIDRVQKRYFSGSETRVDLGVAIRGPERTPASVWQREAAFALQRQLPLSTHVSVSAQAQKKNAIAQLSAGGYLGPLTELVHATHASDTDLEAIAHADAHVVVTPLTEMRVGYGIAPVWRMIEQGVRMTIGNDTTVLSGNADLFGVMRVVLNLGTGEAENELALSARRVLRMATIDAARALHREAHIGSLTPGKQADVVLVDTHRLDAAPLTDPFAFVTEAAQPAYVRHVFAQGRWVKRDGHLTHIDTDALIRDVDAAWERLRAGGLAL